MKNRIPILLFGALLTFSCAAFTFPRALGLDGNIVTKLMNMDRNRDGAVARTEVSDSRLLAIFDRYDANKDGSLTREEVIAGAEKDSPGSTVEESPTSPTLLGTVDSEGRSTIARPSGIGGGGAPMPLPTANAPVSTFPSGLVRIGQVVPDDIKESLDLSDKQKKQIDDMEKDIASRLERIMNAKQFQLLKDRLEDRANHHQSKQDLSNRSGQTKLPADGDK